MTFHAIGWASPAGWWTIATRSPHGSRSIASGRCFSAAGWLLRRRISGARAGPDSSGIARLARTAFHRERLERQGTVPADCFIVDLPAIDDSPKSETLCRRSREPPTVLGCGSPLSTARRADSRQRDRGQRFAGSENRWSQRHAIPTGRFVGRIEYWKIVRAIAWRGALSTELVHILETHVAAVEHDRVRRRFPGREVCVARSRMHRDAVAVAGAAQRSAIRRGGPRTSPKN